MLNAQSGLQLGHVKPSERHDGNLDLPGPHQKPVVSEATAGFVDSQTYCPAGAFQATQ